MTQTIDKPTLAERALLTAGGAMWSTATPGDVPALTMADGPMGVASGRVDERDVAVLTPAPVALGASWDADLVRRVGAVVGSEAARSGVDALLAPNLNLPRSPLCGRAFEYFSEDPLLTGSLGLAWAEGLQSQGVGAIPKHVTCNDSETDRHRVDVQIDEPALREVYMLPFEMTLPARPAGFLMAYNRVNGSYCSESALLMERIIKGDWQFPGLLVSDWFGVQDGLAATSAGLDLEMPGPGRHMGPQVAEMVAKGQVPPERLEDAASRVEATARRFSGRGRVTPLDRETLTEAAAAGMVLLKNDGAILPLDPARLGKVALIGPNWFAPCYQGGTFAKIAVDPDLPTPGHAVVQALAGCAVTVAQGCLPQAILPPMRVTPAETLPDSRGRGMVVRYYDSQNLDRPPVAQETRDTNSLTWFARTGIAAVVDRPAGIRAEGIFTPEHPGPHVLCAGGSGAIRVLVDGVEVHRNDTVYAPADVMGRLKSGEADRIAVTFPDRRPRRITIELRYAAAHVQGLWYGIEGPLRDDALLAEAEAAARAADLVLLMLGETSDASVESRDRDGTALPEAQLALLRRVVAANPRTVALVNVGHALDLSFADQVPGLMLALYPGQEFAAALADVLLGRREPGGRLAFSIARADGDYPAFGLQPDAQGRLDYAEGRRIGYRGMTAAGKVPRFGLGAGLGYASPALVEARLDGDRVVARLTNAAPRAGKAVVQVYGQLPGEDFPCLIGHATTLIAADGEAQLAITPDPRPLRRWRQDGWQMPGPVRLHVGLTLAEALSRPALMARF